MIDALLEFILVISLAFILVIAFTGLAAGILIALVWAVINLEDLR